MTRALFDKLAALECFAILEHNGYRIQLLPMPNAGQPILGPEGHSIIDEWGYSIDGREPMMLRDIEANPQLVGDSGSSYFRDKLTPQEAVTGLNILARVELHIRQNTGPPLYTATYKIEDWCHDQLLSVRMCCDRIKSSERINNGYERKL